MIGSFMKWRSRLATKTRSTKTKIERRNRLFVESLETRLTPAHAGIDTVTALGAAASNFAAKADVYYHGNSIPSGSYFTWVDADGNGGNPQGFSGTANLSVSG